MRRRAAVGAPRIATAWAHAILSHSKGAAIVVEEDATTMTKFFLVRFIAMKRDFRLLKKVTGPYNVWVVWLKV